MNHDGKSVTTKISKPSTLGTKLYSVTPLPKSKVIPKAVEKNDLSKSVTSHLTTKNTIEKCTKVLTSGLLQIECEPINAHFKNNRVVHRDYLRVTKEHVATLQELLEQARALKPLDEHIGRVSSTNASGSKPRSNTKNDRIPQPSSRSMKNIVEAHHRKFKSSTDKNNHVSDCNADVKNVALSKNSDTICLSCNECLKWVPTGRTFNLGEKPCPPSSSNDTSAIVVPPGHILTTTIILVDIPCLKLTLRYVNACESLSKCMLNTDFHPFNLHDFGIKRIIRDEELPPWMFDYLGIVEIVLWYLDSGCSKHMTGHRLGHNLFFIGKLCDSDLEVAFRKHTCFVWNLEGVDLLSGSCGSMLYTISMADMMKSSLICLFSKVLKKKSWLWHRRLSQLNFGTINQLAKQGLVKRLPKLKYTKDHLCSACQMGKSKKESHPHKPEPSTNEKLQILHMDLCRPMRFLRTKDEAPEIIIKFLKQDQVSLNAIVRYLRTDNGTKFINETLHNYMEEVGITYTTSNARTPQQNGVVERCNRTLVEAARTMLIFSKSLLFLWAEAVATSCYTQNRSLVHTRYNKTPYELLRDRKPKLKYLHVFGALCYQTNDFEDLRKLQPKADIGISSVIHHQRRSTVSTTKGPDK
ncbi:retrovirus-related pol polyprotein from transposon TNT 1-94 [Tanacetum coccineum]